MDTTRDNPLDIPLRTLQAIDMAGAAARRTRQSIEAARAAPIAGLAMAVVGIGAFSISSDALSAGAEAVLSAISLLYVVFGLVISYSWIWQSRTGKYAGPLRQPAATITSVSRKRLIAFYVVLACLMALEQAAFIVLRGRIPDAWYFGSMIWTLRLTVIGSIGFLVYRYVRVGFWEHLAFAAGVAGTWGFYIFSSRNWGVGAAAQATIAVLSLVLTLIAAVSMMARTRHWLRKVGMATATDLGSEEAV